MTDTSSMNIGIIGDGNVAHFLGHRLKGSAYHITHIYARNKDEGVILADEIGATLMPNLQQLVSSVNGIIVAVSDASIQQICEDIGAIPDMWLCHTSGSVPSSILSANTEHYGVLWPIYSIISTSLPRHRDIPLIITASNVKVRNVIQSIASIISDISHYATDDDKQKMHLLAVMSNNFVNHLIALGQDYAASERLDYRLILPIIQQTIDRLMDGSYASTLQTGPARRKDMNSIDTHRSLLRQHPSVLRLYDMITQSIVAYYHKD